MGTIDIVDPHSFLDEHYEGALIREVTTRYPGSRRWVNIALYRLDPGGYLVHRTGMSLVYHQADGGCTRTTGRPSGDPATHQQLPDDAMSCDICEPPWPEDLEDSEQVRFEFPQHSVDQFETAAQATEKLTTARPRGGQQARRIVSAPVRELLNDAALLDDGFAEQAGLLKARGA